MNTEDAPARMIADPTQIEGESKEWAQIRTRRVGVNRAVAWACVVGVMSAAWWALAVPVRIMPRTPREPDSMKAFTKKDETRTLLDLADFRAPLWVAPPAPPPAPVAPPVVVKPAPEPPAPPMKWQLLAIMLDETLEGKIARRAMVYDPEADLILSLASGDQHHGRKVESVGVGWLVIRDGKHGYTLRLDPQARGGSERVP